MMKCFACRSEGINGGNREVGCGLAEDECGGEEGEERWRWCLDIYHCLLGERFHIVRIRNGCLKYFSDVSGRSGRVHKSIRLRASVRSEGQKGGAGGEMELER